MALLSTIALHLVLLTGPGGQPILVNPDTIVSIRSRRDTEHFHADIKCLLHMADGKVITVVEDCDTVREKLEGED